MNLGWATKIIVWTKNRQSITVKKIKIFNFGGAKFTEQKYGTMSGQKGFFQIAKKNLSIVVA